MKTMTSKVKESFYNVLDTKNAMRFITTLLRIKSVRKIASNTNLIYQGRLPLVAMVAITDNCQCNCSHCGVSTNSTNCGEYSTEQLFNLIDNLKSMNVKQLYLFGGEPLLRRDIIDIIGYATTLGMLVEMDTNGILLTKENVFALKKAGLKQVRVSLDSHLESEHDYSRGLQGTYKKAISGIKNCVDAGLDCHISSYINKKKINSDHIDHLITLNNMLGTKLRLLKPILTGKIMHAEEELFTEEETEKLRSYLKPNKVYWEVEHIDHKKTPFMCSAKLKKYFYISSFGDVQPCCYLPIVFGNIHNRPLKDIIKEMHSSDVYDGDVWQCPMNNKKFREKFFKNNNDIPCDCFKNEEQLENAA